MPDVLIEEKRNYGIDCRNAVWASDEIHAIYHSCGLPDILCDADFVVETEDAILLIEYKNANTPEARAHATATTEYDPFQSAIAGVGDCDRGQMSLFNQRNSTKS